MKRVWSFIIFLFLISFVSAHEVYVLNKQEINQALNLPPLNFWQVIKEHNQEFIFLDLIVISLIIFIFLLSISRFLEKIV
ncbi:MAG: hypothetical protein KatS3mg095_0410 [Candidatus Parcubacteria bacterium]|nr:MAG: hypothetical protein KatS3mg095_0410 [Candidatus Parcubacteria bacterium]